VLPVGWLIFAVLLAVLLTMWVTFTLTRASDSSTANQSLSVALA